ncbi:PAS domain S-box protein [Myxococcota bacterium]|nr:PAS domain S-box protein [Myxococcota bacterium]
MSQSKYPSQTRYEIIREFQRLRKARGGKPHHEQVLEHPARPDARFQQVLERVGAMLLEIDEEGRVCDVSDTGEQITGYKREQWIGQTALFSVHDDDLSEVAKLTTNVEGKGRPSRALFRFRARTGEWIWLETSSVREFQTPEGSVHTLAFTQDVTERTQAEHLLRESIERNRVVSELSYDMISEADDQGNILFASPNVEKLTGYTFDELHAMLPFERVHPEDLERVEGLGFSEQSELPSIVEIRPYRFQHRNGKWIWLESNLIHYKGRSGEVRILAVTRDITETLRAARERLELEERIEQAQRLESLGVMAGGIAHDFNNLLTPILGGAGLAMMDLTEDDPIRARLEKIQLAAQRAAALTEQMLAYAGAEELEMAPLNVTRLIGDVGQLLESAISGRTVLAYELQRHPPSTTGDSSQLSQVLMILVTNAAEAMGDEEGRVTIRTGSETIEETPAGVVEPESPLEPGLHVFFEVEDTGEGIEPENLERIFEPFFTTKFTGRGLGLAAAEAIVRRHSGIIQLESRVNHGSRIRVLLPALP